MRLLLLFILASFLFNGCNEGADLLTDKTYTAEKIGWTINLPGEKWKVMTTNELMGHYDVANPKLDYTVNPDSTGTEYLINLQKDISNFLMASIQPFDSKKFSSYDQMLTEIHQVIKDSYAFEKIPAGYQIGATRIDGLMLDRFAIRIPPKLSGDKLFFQEFYSCMIKNYVLLISLNYNNENAKATLLNILNSSNFTIKSDL